MSGELAVILCAARIPADKARLSPGTSPGTSPRPPAPHPPAAVKPRARAKASCPAPMNPTLMVRCGATKSHLQPRRRPRGRAPLREAVTRRIGAGRKRVANRQAEGRGHAGSPPLKGERRGLRLSSRQRLVQLAPGVASFTAYADRPRPAAASQLRAARGRSRPAAAARGARSLLEASGPALLWGGGGRGARRGGAPRPGGFCACLHSVSHFLMCKSGTRARAQSRALNARTYMSAYHSAIPGRLCDEFLHHHLLIKEDGLWK